MKKIISFVMTLVLLFGILCVPVTEVRANHSDYYSNVTGLNTYVYPNWTASKKTLCFTKNTSKYKWKISSYSSFCVPTNKSGKCTSNIYVNISRNTATKGRIGYVNVKIYNMSGSYKETVKVTFSQTCQPKYYYRNKMDIVVQGCKTAGFTYAASCLEHSLQDYPSALRYNSASGIAKKLKSTSEYKSIKSKIKNKVATMKKKKIKSVSASSSIALRSNKDLFLALHNVKYSYTIKRQSNGKYAANIIFSDTYDFAYQNYKSANGLPSKVVSAVNNYAYKAQANRAIVPYNIYITINETDL